MRTSICSKALFVCACLVTGCTAWGQSLSSESQAPARLDLAVTYNPVVANITTPNEFGMQGGSAQLQARVWHGLGLVADVAGLRSGNVNNSGVALDLLTTTFGPRYTWKAPHRRLVFFAQTLVGDAYGLSGLFPSPNGVHSTGNSLALQMGGGIDMPLWSHLAVRAFDAQWLRTYLPNATTNVQNNLRLGVGVVYRFM